LTIVHETDRQIERGLSLHRSGNLKAAAEIYQRVLARKPNQPDALYLMGCLTQQTGDSSVAVGLLEKAIAARPSKPEYYYALGTALAQLENYDLAESNLRQAVRLGSRPEFHVSLGMLLKKQRRLAEATAEFEAAVASDKDDADAHFNLGNAHQAAGKFEDAIAHLEQVLKLRRGHAPTLAALRQALGSANREAEAVAHLEQAMVPLRANAERLCDFADSLQQAEDFGGAIEVYHRALALAPQSPRAWFACGCAELAREDFASAIPCFEKALQMRPEWLEARHNLARALYEMGQVRQAYEEFKVCAARTEDGARLARAMIAVIAPGAPQACNQDVLEMRQAWVKDLEAGDSAIQTPPAIRSASERLKIGYVSSFFSRDNWMKPVWGLINQHDRLAFDIHLFSDAPISAIPHGYYAHQADHFFDTTRLSNQALADLIRENGIHVLVDLNGYSDINRLPLYMLRPAPVIVAWFNMYATSGMPCFDYVIGDRDVIPPEEEAFYSEKVQRVTHSYLTFSVDYPVPPVAELPCISNSPFTFGCLGSQYKITSEVVEAWSRILTASPASRLLLKNKQLKTRAAREFMETQFLKSGVAPGRLLFEGPESHFDFLKAYDRVDVALDTFPYNGGTTTTEAIWQGVPVITFPGDRWASRTSASILRAAGLQLLIANSLEGYISLAASLANAPDERPSLASLRATMRNQLKASSVCDTPAFAREMETIYRKCWENRSTQ
jgi:protein O-GlcNAc transferase